MDKSRHLISKYLDGELSSVELSRFEEVLEKDQVLQSELELYKEVEEALSDTEVLNLRAQLELIHEEYTPRIERIKERTTKKVFKYAIAAGIAMAVSLGTYGLFFNHASGNRIVSQFYKPYDVTLVNRSENTSLDMVLKEGLMYYENEEYTKAIPLFNKVLKMNPKNIASNLYAGISQFEIHQYEDANASFNNVIQHNDNLYIEQADWYLGFCYLMMNEREKAIVQFTKLKDGDGIYRKDARKILKSIN